MANTYTLISSNVLTSSAASVTFSSIPGTYTDLVVRVSARSDASGTIVLTGYLNDSSSNYSYTRLRGNGATVASARSTGPGYIYGGLINDSGSTSSTFGNLEWYIPSYTVSQNKPISTFAVTENNATTAYIDTEAVLWSDTSTITKLELIPSSGNFVSGSSFWLYGIKKD